MLVKQVLMLTVIFLTACSTVITPQDIGFSQNEWQNYSPIYQQQFLENYKQINEELQVLNTSPNVLSKSALYVQINGGLAMMPPFTVLKKFKPVQFVINQDECSETILEEDGIGEGKVAMLNCYLGNKLFLDASRYDLTRKHGSITLVYSPLWQKGYTYTGVNSTGYVRFANSSLKIKTVLSQAKTTNNKKQ
jgi:hypothetical protein